MLRRTRNIREAFALAVNAQLISRRDNLVQLVAARGCSQLGATDACLEKASTEATAIRTALLSK